MLLEQKTNNKPKDTPCSVLKGKKSDCRQCFAGLANLRDAYCGPLRISVQYPSCGLNFSGLPVPNYYDLLRSLWRTK